MDDFINLGHANVLLGYDFSASNRRLLPIACSKETDQEDDVSSSSSGECFFSKILFSFCYGLFITSHYDLNSASKTQL